MFHIQTMIFLTQDIISIFYKLGNYYTGGVIIKIISFTDIAFGDVCMLILRPGVQLECVNSTLVGIRIFNAWKFSLFMQIEELNVQVECSLLFLYSGLPCWFIAFVRILLLTFRQYILYIYIIKYKLPKQYWDFAQTPPTIFHLFHNIHLEIGTSIKKTKLKFPTSTLTTQRFVYVNKPPIPTLVFETHRPVSPRFGMCFGYESRNWRFMHAKRGDCANKKSEKNGIVFHLDIQWFQIRIDSVLKIIIGWERKMYEIS